MWPHLISLDARDWNYLCKDKLQKPYGMCPHMMAIFYYLLKGKIQLKDDIFPSCKITVSLYGGRWWIFGFSMLLLLTDGGSMIGITSTSHFLQYSTLAFQTIKIFHHHFLLELIFSLHHWWLENCYEYLQTSPHQIKIFLWFIFILLHIVPLPNVCR